MRPVLLLVFAGMACLGCQNDTPGFDPFMRRHYVPPPPTGSFRPSGPPVAPYYPGPPASSAGVPGPIMAPPTMSMPPPAFRPAPVYVAPPAAVPSSQPSYQGIQQPMPPGVPGFNSRASHSPPWPRPETAAVMSTPLMMAYSPRSHEATAPLDASGWRPVGGSPTPASHAIASERPVAIR